MDLDKLYNMDGIDLICNDCALFDLELQKCILDKNKGKEEDKYSCEDFIEIE